MDDIPAVLAAVASELTATRKRQGLTRRRTVERVAERTGGAFSVAALLAYENGDRPLTVERLLQLAAAYDIPAPVLLQEAIRRAGGDIACPTCGRD